VPSVAGCSTAARRCPALVAWLQREHPTALPQVRNEGPAGVAADGAARPPEGLFTGSAEPRERSRAFTGPSEEEQAERDRVEETAGAER
jgi:hypothetical protein